MRTVAASLLLMLTACSSGPTGVDASCTAALFANDILYVPIDEFVDPPAVSEEPELTVTRYDPACRDQGEKHDPIEGESNFLAEGTAIHGVEGFGPLQKLTYWDSQWQSWRSLIPPPSCAAPVEGAVISFEPPCEG
jgi:hypothetical protein